MSMRNILQEAEASEGYRAIGLRTRLGEVEGRLYPVRGARSGVVLVGGVGGGWDTPARGLYPALARGLQQDGIACLRVKFRHPTVLEESVNDALAGLQHLTEDGASALGLVGHSFGGAVAVQAGALSGRARTIVTLSTQSYGADVAARLPEACSMLVIHGARDQVLPVSCSLQVYAWAHEPKELEIYEDAGHVLDESAEQVGRKVRSWLKGELKRRK